MLTKQYEQALVASIVGPAGESVYYDYSEKAVTCKSTDVNTTYLKLYPIRYDFGTKTGTQSDGTVSFWSGASEPSKDDIKPDGTEVTNFTYNMVFQNTGDENGATCTRVYTITNSGSETITIDTVCLIGSFQWGYGSAFKVRILYDKTQLETPVTIEPGGVGQITYSIRMNNPV